VEEDAVEDIVDFEEKWAKTDAVITMRSGSLQAGKVQEKTRPALPTGLQDIVALSEKGIADNGVDPAFLGDVGAQETGILYKRRIRQILTKFWWVADANTLYQKEDARLCADLMRIWIQNNTGEIMRLTGQDGVDEFVQLSEDMLAPEYDIDIQEAPESPEDKQETAMLVGAMGDKYLSVGDVARASALHSESIQMISTLDGDIKNRISRVLVGDNQMVPMAQYQQLQQQLQQLQNALTQAQVQKLQSETAVNMARINDLQANVREKGASTMQKIEDARQKNIETQVIRQHAGQANVTV
jgi:flagellar biosynthesis chaperone FliJ